MTSCCFTGHRRIADAVLSDLEQRLDDCLYRLIDEKIYHFRAGGAVGFDRIAAEHVLQMRRRFDFIRLELILPCHGQTRGWPEEERLAYRRIMADADRVTFLQEHYTSGCMKRRNLKLLEDSQICVCYCTRQVGGTAFTIANAQKQGLRIINLALT
ncbi:MAG: DUF1273 family protein [Clostridia bacterium]|nr:DUF1273 family protein [Clostridia bacterium]